MSDETRSKRTVAPAPERAPLMLQVSRWDLLIVSLLLIVIFALRQTGNLPGQTIRILDVTLVAVILGLVLHAARPSRRTMVAHGVIATASVLVAIVGIATSSIPIQRVAAGISSYALAAAAFLVFRLVLAQRRVTGDTLFGALAGYLALGVMFAGVFTVIARGDPAAFDPPQPVIDGQSDLYYFSFVTLTSLGYGDISPSANLTRILTPIEAVLGVVILAALVGRIVGLLVAQTTDSDTQARLDELTRAVECLKPDQDQ